MAAQAVDLWRKHRPDVTLLDVRMPKLDGVGVIDEIRRRILRLGHYTLPRMIRQRDLPGDQGGSERLSAKRRSARGIAGLYPESKPRRNLHTASAGGKACGRVSGET